MGRGRKWHFNKWKFEQILLRRIHKPYGLKLSWKYIAQNTCSSSLALFPPYLYFPACTPKYLLVGLVPSLNCELLRTLVMAYSCLCASRELHTAGPPALNRYLLNQIDFKRCRRLNTNGGNKVLRIQESWPLVDFLSVGNQFGLYS